MLPGLGAKTVEDLNVNGHRALPLPRADEQDFINGTLVSLCLRGARHRACRRAYRENRSKQGDLFLRMRVFIVSVIKCIFEVTQTLWRTYG